MRITIFIFSLFFSLAVFASGPTLKKSDIRRTMGQILQYHIESNQLSEKHIKRAIKIYIDQFDPIKIYLLQTEVAPFLDLTSQELRRAVAQFDEEDCTLFLALNQVIQNSIERGIKMRKEIARKLILEGKEKKGVSEKTYLGYAKNRDELEKRIHNHLLQYLNVNKKINQREWTFQRKEKLLAFFIKQKKRFEKTYELEDELGEHRLPP